MNFYSALYKPFLSKAIRYGPCVMVLPANRTQTIPGFTPQPQGVTVRQLVLIAPTYKGRARLSWPGWTVLCGIMQTYALWTGMVPCIIWMSP